MGMGSNGVERSRAGTLSHRSAAAAGAAVAQGVVGGGEAGSPKDSAGGQLEAGVEGPLGEPVRRGLAQLERRAAREALSGKVLPCLIFQFA